MFFHSLSLEAFCHATEDVERVKEAIAKLLPVEVESKKFLLQRLEGSFGNEIIGLKLTFEKQSEINDIIKHLKPSVSDLDIEDHVTDEGRFWVRFDKQKAYSGEVVLGGEDTIQLKGKVAAFPAKLEKAVEVMKKLWSD